MFSKSESLPQRLRQFAREALVFFAAMGAGMFVFALCVLPILAVTKVGDWPAVLLIALAGSAHQAWSANLYTTVSDMFPKKDVATIIGLGGMTGSAASSL